MPPELIPSDSDYASEEDSDFAPDTLPAPELESSDSESEDEGTIGKDGKSRSKVEGKGKSKKRKRGEEEAEDLGFENSGDEAVIKEYDSGGAAKRKGKKGRVAELELEDEGGEGGVVMTRSMRALEKVEKKPLLDTSKATIDVDAVFSAMMSGNPPPIPTPPPNSTEAPPLTSPSALSPTPKRNTLLAQESRKDPRSPSTLSDGPDSMIMIKRTYTFAGKVHTEQKLVPRNSAEAKLYLSSLPDPSNAPQGPAEEETPSPFIKPKRPVKKARRSIFEPIPADGWPKRNDLFLGERREESGVGLTRLVGGKEKKLNTVEKSAMDWAGFVDKEGIKDELDAAGKSKGAYKARQEFLARIERKKVEDERRARGLPVL